MPPHDPTRVSCLPHSTAWRTERRDLSQITLTDEFRHALDLIERQGHSVFLTGKAGTGKSTFLHYLRETTDKTTVVLAPTGVAALNVGGQTIHSFFQLPPTIIDPQSLRRRKNPKLFHTLQTLIIDDSIKARKYKLAAKGAFVFLKTQQFRYHDMDVRFSRTTPFPQEIIKAIAPAFAQLFRPGEEYRATGVVLLKLEEDDMVQLDLLGETVQAEKFSRVYQAVDHMREQYGKRTVFLGSSFLAHKFGQQLGERGDEPLRKTLLFKGKTKRKRLNIPMFLGKMR